MVKRKDPPDLQIYKLLLREIRNVSERIHLRVCELQQRYPEGFNAGDHSALDHRNGDHDPKDVGSSCVDVSSMAVRERWSLLQADRDEPSPDSTSARPRAE